MHPYITPDMSLPELVEHSPGGTLFFHNHTHAGSYQILAQSLPGFQRIGVKQFYIELSIKIFKGALEDHFRSQGKSDALDRVFNQLVKNDSLTRVKDLIESAHRIGIQVLAVDINDCLNEDKHLAAEVKAAESIINQRLSKEEEIAQLIQSHIRQLSTGDKFIGLFGGNHTRIGKVLNVCMVCLHAMPLEKGVSHQNLLPHQITGTDKKSTEVIKQYHVITLVPQEFGDWIDFSQETNSSRSLMHLNRLLKTLSLPECKAYLHKNSAKKSAAVFIQEEHMQEIWPAVVKLMDPFAKRCELVNDQSDQMVIIFEDIDQESVRHKIIASLVNLTKKEAELTVAGKNG